MVEREKDEAWRRCASAVCKAVKALEPEYACRGPKEPKRSRCWIVDEMVVDLG
jgi:hypothetical protein